MERQPENQKHDQKKHRNRKVLVREHSVDFHTPDVFSALPTFFNRFWHTFSIKVYRMSANAAFRSSPQSFSISAILCSIISSSFSERARRSIMSVSFSTIFVAAKARGHPDIYRMILHDATPRECSGVPVPCSQKSMTLGIIFCPRLPRSPQSDPQFPRPSPH